jgi:hypothetical protein
MENETEIERQKVHRIFIRMFVAFAAILISIIAVFVWLIQDGKKANEEKNVQLLNEQKLNSTCSYKRDSLVQIVNELSIYRSLTQAMVNRDEATSPLKYKVGNMVYLKRDSAKVVISDIIIGGSKYEYYVKYKVLHKDNVSEEVIPELIY